VTLPRHFAIRADASATIGVGHIMRCIVIADELARCGVPTTFLCSEITQWAQAQVRDHGHSVVMLTVGTDAMATVAACETLGAKLLLVDHYELKTDWCEAVVGAGIRLCAVDDLAEVSRPAELLVDPGLGRRAADYSVLIPPSAICLTGMEFGLLRPEFALMRHRKPVMKKGAKHIVISMGGSDPMGQSLVCLEALDGNADIRITVVLTSGAPHLEAVQARVGVMQTPTILLIDHGEMAELLASADLAIGASGGSALERCVLGVPSLLSVQAENQRVNAEYLAEVGAVELMADASGLRKQIDALLRDPDRLQDMANAAEKLCDGRGGARVALGIVSLCSDVCLRPVQLEDMRQVFDWQCAPGARQFSHNPEPPTWEDHQAWFEKRMGGDPFYIIEVGRKAVGFVRLDQKSTDKSEVSILLSVDAQGKGLGQIALTHLRLTHPQRHIVASVHPENAASQALFRRAGFRQERADTFVSAGWDATAMNSKKDEQDAD
jgi:UDP-2,4-diacetamido-2,4,6-trideoxy-beta-L-altropyranose hydrolase